MSPSGGVTPLGVDHGLGGAVAGMGTDAAAGAEAVEGAPGAIEGVAGGEIPGGAVGVPEGVGGVAAASAPDPPEDGAPEAGGEAPAAGALDAEPIGYQTGVGVDEDISVIYSPIFPSGPSIGGLTLRKEAILAFASACAFSVCAAHRPLCAAISFCLRTNWFIRLFASLSICLELLASEPDLNPISD